MPMIPTMKMVQDTMVLIYLKMCLISAGFTHTGSRGGSEPPLRGRLSEWLGSLASCSRLGWSRLYACSWLSTSKGTVLSGKTSGVWLRAPEKRQVRRMARVVGAGMLAMED